MRGWEPPDKKFPQGRWCTWRRLLGGSVRSGFSGSEDDLHFILTARMQPSRLLQLPVPFGILHRGSACCNLGCRLHLLKEAADGIGWLGLKLRLAPGVLFKTACN